MSEPLELDGRSLTLEQFLAVVRGGQPVMLSSEAREAITLARRAVERIVASGRPVYGVNTGVGALSQVTIPRERILELQTSLVRSHASGSGPALATEAVRGLLLLRTNSLARGLSGVRLGLVEMLVELLNRKLVPWIPEQGSVGASGDLAPLAHLALALSGEGTFVSADGRPQDAATTLRQAGLAPLVFQEKEGIALLNGTALMASYLALATADASTLLDAATIACAMSFDALLGDPAALDDRVGIARNLPAQRESARALRALLKDSQLATPRTQWAGQDPYTLRCVPQVLAAVRLGIDFAEGIIRGELNAATDNPLIFEGDEAISGGNFHGQPLALALDALALAVHYLASFSERRVARLLHPALNRGLPAFLAPANGVSSGLMIPQYLAAALVNENMTLVYPASAGSLPTSADQEDFVSMGPWAGVKLRRILQNTQRVVAIEWIVAGQGLEMRHPKAGGKGSEAALRALRGEVEPWAQDRSPSNDIERVAQHLASGGFVRSVRAEVAFS